MNTLKILVTAGATREHIDPVRFISNPSTGVMGAAIAKAAKERKHGVTFLAGAGCVDAPGIKKRINFESIDELKSLVLKHLRHHDVLIMTAAVGDYRPTVINKHKMQRQKGMVLKLIQTPDILKAASKKYPNKIIIGFCLETSDLIHKAKQKRIRKNCHAMVGCQLGSKKNPFGKNQLQAILVDDSGNVIFKGYRSKSTISRLVIRYAEKLSS